MQAVLMVPGLNQFRTRAEAITSLRRKVGGVPLLVRVIAASMRSGCKDLILVWPSEIPRSVWTECNESEVLRGLKTRVIEAISPDPRKPGIWALIEPMLEAEFLCLRWNVVTTGRILAGIETQYVLPLRWNVPVRLSKDALYDRRVRTEKEPLNRGVSVSSAVDIQEAERFLVKNSGKSTDGIYSKFNRQLSRPFVRALAHTSVTPNMVTVAGLLVAILSAIAYSQGGYLFYVAGAVLFFISGLIDEMDGMLARITFRESAFGTWFEGFVDNVTYLLLFLGITVGLYRQRGKTELLWGLALIVGCILSVLVVARQRKAVTAPDRPHEYSARMNRIMEADGGLIARVARQIHIFVKKGVVVHYVVIFTVLGVLPVFLRIAAIGANLTWTIGSYFTWKLKHRCTPAQGEILRPAA